MDRGWDRPAGTTVDVSGAPLLGSLLDLQRDPLALLLRGVDHDLACFKFGPRSAFLLNHPDLVRRILVDRVDAYDKRTAGNKVFRLVLGESLVTSDGEYWKRQRRIAAPAFHHHRIRGFAEQMSASVREMLARWSALPAGAFVDVDAEMVGLTVDVVCRCLIGNASSGALADVFRKALPSLLTHAVFKATRPWYPGLWAPTPKNRAFIEARAAVWRAIEGIIAERRASQGAGEHGDLLEMLMMSVDEETGEKMNDLQLRDEVITIVLTGYETSTTMLDWTFVALAAESRVRDALEQELSALADRAVTFEDLASLTYTEAVLKESLRLHPPVWIMVRRAAADDVILDRKVPEGSVMFVSPYVTHRRPDFFPEPKRFRPERFLEEAPPRLVHIPFGGGRRVCIGNAFAMVQGKIFLAEICRRFRLEVAEGCTIEPLPKVTLAMKHGLRMTLHAR